MSTETAVAYLQKGHASNSYKIRRVSGGLLRAAAMGDTTLPQGSLENVDRPTEAPSMALLRGAVGSVFAKSLRRGQRALRIDEEAKLPLLLGCAWEHVRKKRLQNRESRIQYFLNKRQLCSSRM